jgi:ABC-type Fe3+ transport system permease subunit
MLQLRVYWWLALLGLFVAVVRVGAAPAHLWVIFSGYSWMDLDSGMRLTVVLYLLHTLLLTVGAGGLALVVGVGAAWLVTMCDYPLRGFFRWALVLPLAVPP